MNFERTNYYFKRSYVAMSLRFSVFDPEFNLKWISSKMSDGGFGWTAVTLDHRTDDVLVGHRTDDISVGHPNRRNVLAGKERKKFFILKFFLRRPQFCETARVVKWKWEFVSQVIVANCPSHSTGFTRPIWWCFVDAPFETIYINYFPFFVVKIYFFSFEMI